MANKDKLNGGNNGSIDGIRDDIVKLTEAIEEDFDPEYFDNEDDDYDLDEDPYNQDYSEAEQKAKRDSAAGNHEKQYREYVNRFPKLTLEKEQELAQKIEEGDLDSRKEFIKLNLLMAYKCARYYKNQLKLKMPHIASQVYVMDLVEQATLGMIEAVDRFDYKKGYRFSIYATHWI